MGTDSQRRVCESHFSVKDGASLQYSINCDEAMNSEVTVRQNSREVLSLLIYLYVFFCFYYAGCSVNEYRYIEKQTNNKNIFFA